MPVCRTLIAVVSLGTVCWVVGCGAVASSGGAGTTAPTVDEFFSVDTGQFGGAGALRVQAVRGPEVTMCLRAPCHQPGLCPVVLARLWGKSRCYNARTGRSW